MNCSYRILKDVHIGLRVRKTKDKKTVPFKNEPMTDVKLVSWNDQGFELAHPDLPKNIWVDFYQLPLDKIQMEYGVIKNPITFVEEIREGGSMVLVRADTLDYMEMLHDKKEKEEAKTYGIRELIPGDRTISAICKEGHIMVYLGTFSIARMETKHNYGYGRSSNTTYMYIDETPERAFFAYEMPDGIYKVSDYAVSNKVVKEVYRCDDKGSARTNPLFLNEDENMEHIRNMMYTSRYSNTKYPKEKRAEITEQYKTGSIKLSNDNYIRYAHIQQGKTDIRKNAVEFIKEHLDVEIYSNKQESKDRIFETMAEMLQQYNKNHR